MEANPGNSGAIDLSLVIQSDPSLCKLPVSPVLVNGFRIVYERVIPFKLQLVLDETLQAKIREQVFEKEDLKVKILVKVNSSE